MHRRYLVLALGLVLALTAITPSIGSQHLVDRATFPVRTAKAAKRIAKTARTLASQALATANAAQQTANEAKQSAQDANATAGAAQTTADQATGTANQAKTAAEATAAELAGLRAKTDTDAPTVTTTDVNTYVDLGGPSVTVTVPASGLIEVWAQVATVDGAVSLYEDGQQVPDQDPNDVCSGPGGIEPPSGVLIAAPGFGPPPFVVSTPGAAGLGGCGSTTAPAPVLFKTSPGQHTYDLRYASCGCNAPDPAEFSDRTLTVAPRP